jgi:hypothetical protein
MATDGTLVDPPGVPSCAVCGSENCRQFSHAPYPDDYPFMPNVSTDPAVFRAAGGYDKTASQDVQPRPIRGARRGGGLRWRS